MAQYRTGAFQTGAQFIPDPRVGENVAQRQMALAERSNKQQQLAREQARKDAERMAMLDLGKWAMGQRFDQDQFQTSQAGLNQRFQSEQDAISQRTGQQDARLRDQFMRSHGLDTQRLEDQRMNAQRAAEAQERADALAGRRFDLQDTRYETQEARADRAEDVENERYEARELRDMSRLAERQNKEDVARLASMFGSGDLGPKEFGESLPGRLQQTWFDQGPAFAQALLADRKRQRKQEELTTAGTQALIDQRTAPKFQVDPVREAAQAQSVAVAGPALKAYTNPAGGKVELGQVVQEFGAAIGAMRNPANIRTAALQVLGARTGQDFLMDLALDKKGKVKTSEITADTLAKATRKRAEVVNGVYRKVAEQLARVQGESPQTFEDLIPWLGRAQALVQDPDAQAPQPPAAAPSVGREGVSGFFADRAEDTGDMAMTALAGMGGAVERPISYLFGEGRGGKGRAADYIDSFARVSREQERAALEAQLRQIRDRLGR